MIHWITFATTLMFLCSARGQVLYDITFSEPTHHVGQAASTSGATNPSMPSYERFGTSVIVNQVGNHDGVFRFLPVDLGSGNALQYSQYGFLTDHAAPYQYMRTSFDIFVAAMSTPASGSYVVGPDDGFSLLFDSPSVSRIDFIGGGRILENDHDIGGYAMGQWISLTVDINLAQNTWSIFRDSVQLTTAEFFHTVPAEPLPPTAIDSIRINLADNQPNPASPLVYLDNFRTVTSQTPFAPIPEPGCYGLIAGVACLFLLQRRFFR